MTRGWTLTEMIVMLVLLGSLTMMVIPSLGGWPDRWAVRRARHEAAGFFRLARLGAMVQAAPVRLSFTVDSLTAVLELPAGDSTLLRREGPGRHGVSLQVTRATIRIAPTGLGSGNANTTLVFHRGQAVDSLVVSRLGRLRIGYP